MGQKLGRRPRGDVDRAGGIGAAVQQQGRQLDAGKLGAKIGGRDRDVAVVLRAVGGLDGRAGKQPARAGLQCSSVHQRLLC
jgi:hypothetical protein